MQDQHKQSCQNVARTLWKFFDLLNYDRPLIVELSVYPSQHSTPPLARWAAQGSLACNTSVSKAVRILSDRCQDVVRILLELPMDPTVSWACWLADVMSLRLDMAARRSSGKTPSRTRSSRASIAFLSHNFLNVKEVFHVKEVYFCVIYFKFIQYTSRSCSHIQYSFKPRWHVNLKAKLHLKLSPAEPR